MTHTCFDLSRSRSKPLRNCLAAFLFAALSAAPVFADFDGLRTAVAEAEETTEEEEESYSSGGGGGENSLAAAFFELFVQVWIVNNFYMSYGEAPYLEGKLIRYPRPVLAGAQDKPDIEFAPVSEKDHWFAAEIQPVWMNGLDAGGSWFSFRGNMWRFFGPWIEAAYLTDGTEHLANARIGANFSIIQTNPFTLGAYFQWQLWSGILDRSSGTMGAYIDSYPFKPVALHFRGGVQQFDGYQIGEAELRGGFLRKKAEYSLGWRWWTVQSNSGTKIEGYSGPFASIGWWF